MRITLVTSIAIAAAMLSGAAVNAAEGKPSRVLAELSFTVPAGLKAGDEVTTTLRFVATQDVEQLKVSVRQRSGLTILSQPYGATFANVRLGTAREFDVRIRLDDENGGILQVRYETRSKTYGTASETKPIVFGEPK